MASKSGTGLSSCANLTLSVYVWLVTVIPGSCFCIKLHCDEIPVGMVLIYDSKYFSACK